MPLTELKIKNLKPRDRRYLVGDGQGLYIAVMPTGEKYWYYRTWENGRERKRSLGRYPDIGLKEARELKYSAKGGEKEKLSLLSDVAEKWFETRCVPANTPRVLADKRSRLDRYVLAQFGGRDIRSISQQEIVAHVRKLQDARGVRLGQCVKGMISQIFRYALASGLCEWNPAAQIAEALSPYRVSMHRSTIRTEGQARELLLAIDGYDGNPVVRLALLLLAHTFVRPGELRLARWPELDFEKKQWRIPAKRMKMRREHIVPLSRQAVELFCELRGVVRHPEFCFIMPCRKTPMSATLMPKAMISLGYGEGRATPHSFRGMASTLLNEHGFPPDVIERQLAHAETNAVRAAYNRAEYMEERRKMMQWWSDYLDRLQNVSG
ncbi:MAG: tyrosine-type recombinase/integrase [Fretibacterium sp.]|nr:tyrosine-type recombinase/integrase [Fretibacterium sp.]